MREARAETEARTEIRHHGGMPLTGVPLPAAGHSSINQQLRKLTCMPSGQSDRNISSIEVPSSHVTLICVKVTKQTIHKETNPHTHKCLLLCGEMI